MIRVSSSMKTGVKRVPQAPKYATLLPMYEVLLSPTMHVFTHRSFVPLFEKSTTMIKALEGCTRVMAIRVKWEEKSTRVGHLRRSV